MDSTASSLDANLTTEIIPVDLGVRSYDIMVGEKLIDRAGTLAVPVLRRKRVFIVTDEVVAPLYLERLETCLKSSGITVDSIILPAGEQTKSFSHLEQLTRQVLAIGMERGDTLVALGGGVIGDLAGFAASILLRGIQYIQIPTTLLAQVDSSVGGKTAIDVPAGKNLVGAFHQPVLVLADLEALDTLPERQMRAGYAEIVKYGLIRNAGFFDWLDAEGHALLAGDRAAQMKAVGQSCRTKAAIVAADEREAGERALLNLGHTFGHALELACGYDDRLLHGEAVAIGMAMAFNLSAELGLCPAADVERMTQHLKRCGLPISPSDIPEAGGTEWSANALLTSMMKDKKVTDGSVTFILVRGIGDAFVSQDVDPTILLTFLSNNLPD